MTIIFFYYRFLTGTDSGMRIGLAPSQRCRDVSNEPWERFTKIYNTMRSEDTVSNHLKFFFS